MKLVFFGTPAFVIPILEQLYTEHALVAVITAPDKKVGRKQIMTPSPVKEWALKHKIPVIHPHTENGEWKMQEIQADLFIVAAYGKIIPQRILDIPTYGSLNVHPSLLPKYRGPSPIQQTILHGDKTTGVTIIKMDDKMDHGPIVAQEYDDVAPIDTFETLANRLFEKSAKLLTNVIPDYVSKKITPKPQDDNISTYTKLITKQDGYIDLNHLPKKALFERMISAYHPWPGVWTMVNSKNKEVRMKFLPDKLVQVEGKKSMEIKEFLNGYPELKEQLTPLL